MADEEATPATNGTNGANGRLKRYSAEEKKRLVEESFAPNESVKSVAERHGVSVNSLWVWRREATAAKDAPAAGGAATDAPPADNKKWRARVAAIEAEADELRRKVSDLERMLGRKTVELEMMRDAAARRR